jgi:AAA domain
VSTSTLPAAFLEAFAGRVDCYGQGNGDCVKRPVTEGLIAAHLAGKVAIGIYPLVDDRCRWSATDLDLDGESDLEQWGKARTLYESSRRLGCCPFIEKSKSKGYHIWVFYREPVEARWARQVAAKAIADAGLPPETEIFPKQDRVDDVTPYGNYVNLPYHGPNGNGRRVMLDPTTGKPWTVDEFLSALTLTDPNDVLVARDSKPVTEGYLIVGGDDAARLLGEDAPLHTRHDKGKRVIGLLVTRLWQDGEQAVLDAALNWNEAHCKPPLPEAEVKQMVRDFWRKEAAKRAKEGVKVAPSFRFWTGAEIAAAVPVEIDWAVKPYLVRGAATELSGHIKHGKTTLTGHLCRAVLDGADFLGEPTAKGPVVYITEQPPASFRQLIEAAGLDRDDFYVLYWLNTLGRPWPEVAEAAVNKALEVGAVLLVADTLSQLAGLKGDEENQAGAAQEALQPLQEAACKGIAVLALRQDRKSGGEVGDSGRGSGAFGGGFDILVALKRPQGQPRDTIRVLESISRFGHVPANLAIELTPEGYVALGTSAAVAEAEAEEAILEALPSDEDMALPLTTKEDQPSIKTLLPEHVGEITARRALQKLAEAGKVGKTGAGKKGNPFRYWRRR